MDKILMEKSGQENQYLDHSMILNLSFLTQSGNSYWEFLDLEISNFA